MKRALFVIVAAAALTALADDPPPFDLKKKPQTEEEKAARKAYIEDRFNKHTGGRLIVPGSLKGKIVYVNAQKRAPDDSRGDCAAVVVVMVVVHRNWHRNRPAAEAGARTETRARTRHESGRGHRRHCKDKCFLHLQVLLMMC